MIDPSHNDFPQVTVIMPILNEANFIRQSLGAVLTQDYPAESLEIIVVDGGSTDNTLPLVQGLRLNHPNLRLLHNPKRIQAAALNIGIMAARGEIVIRVDGHTLIAPNYVRCCVEYLRQGKADNVGGLMRPVGTTYCGKAIALATSSPFGIGGSKFHYSEREQYVDTVYMGAFRRTIFDRIGLFDEQLKINEDYEFNYRLRQAGGKILLSPTLNSSYVPRQSLGALWRQYFQYGHWKVRMLQKHPASLRWRQTAPPLFVSSLVGNLLLGIFWRPALWLLGIILSLYLLINLAASIAAAHQAGWRYFLIVPVIFMIIHCAWGLGFWYGVMAVRLPNSRN